MEFQKKKNEEEHKKYDLKEAKITGKLVLQLKPKKEKCGAK